MHHIIKNVSRILSVMGVVLMAGFAPVIVFAQSLSPYGTSGSAALGQTKTLNDLVAKAISLFNVAIYLIIAIAILTFVWNVYQYFIVNDPENKKEAGTYVMYSVIGIFVILSFWGLVNIVSNTLNLNTSPGTLNVSNLLSGIGGSSGSNAFSPTPTLNTGTSPGASYSPTGIPTYNTGTTYNAGGTSVSSGYNGGNLSGYLAPGSTPAQYQQAYQANANNLQQSLQANNCYTSTGGIVATPSCQSLQSAYINAQNQANFYAPAGTTGSNPTAGMTAAQAQGYYNTNCINSVGPVQTPNCQAVANQLQSSGAASGGSTCAPGDYDPSCFPADSTYNSSQGSDVTQPDTSQNSSPNPPENIGAPDNGATESPCDSDSGC